MCRLDVGGNIWISDCRPDAIVDLFCQAAPTDDGGEAHGMPSAVGHPHTLTYEDEDPLGLGFELGL